MIVGIGTNAKETEVNVEMIFTARGYGMLAGLVAMLGWGLIKERESILWAVGLKSYRRWPRSAAPPARKGGA
jgi:hypothetical protein